MLQLIRRGAWTSFHMCQIPKLKCFYHLPCWHPVPSGTEVPGNREASVHGASASPSDLSALPAPILNSSRNIGIIPVARTYAVEGLKDWYNLGKLKVIEKRVKSSTWLGSVRHPALLSLCLPMHTAAFVGLGLRSPILWQKWGHFPPIL